MYVIYCKLVLVKSMTDESDLGSSYCRLVLIPEGAGARLSHQLGFYYKKVSCEWLWIFVQCNVVSLQILSILSVRSQLNILFDDFLIAKARKAEMGPGLGSSLCPGSLCSLLSVSWEAALETTHRDSCGQRGTSEWRLYCSAVTLKWWSASRHINS